MTTSGKVDFTLSYLGFSSSMTLDEIIFLPTKAIDANATWFVNRIKGGNLETVGEVVVTGGTTATYVPPDCPPAVNPVHIEAEIESKSGLAVPYFLLGSVEVQVVPRDWTMEWSVDATRLCSADGVSQISGVSASDHAIWIGDQNKIRFSLTDGLQFVDFSHKFGSPTHNFQACPCAGTAKIEELGTDTPGLKVLVSGYWDTVKMKMHYDATVNYLYLGGDVTCTYQGIPVDNGTLGSEFYIQIFGGEIPNGYSGKVTTRTGDFREWAVSINYTLTSVCP